MKKPLCALLICLVVSPAWAGTTTLNYSPSGSSPLRFTTDGSSYNLNNITIWDYSAGANGLGITTNNAAKMEGVGSAGTATGGVLTVQGVASMTPFLVTLQASASTAIGKVDPNTIATWGLMSGNDARHRADEHAGHLAAFTIRALPGATNGQTLPFQMTTYGTLFSTIYGATGNQAYVTVHG